MPRTKGLRSLLVADVGPGPAGATGNDQQVRARGSRPLLRVVLLKNTRELSTKRRKTSQTSWNETA